MEGEIEELSKQIWDLQEAQKSQVNDVEARPSVMAVDISDASGIDPKPKKVLHWSRSKVGDQP